MEGQILINDAMNMFKPTYVWAIASRLTEWVRSSILMGDDFAGVGESGGEVCFARQRWSIAETVGGCLGAMVDGL